jgi:hypothetical protein
LLGRCGGHGSALGRTAQDDCIVDVQHLYRDLVFELKLLYISMLSIDAFMFSAGGFQSEIVGAAT